MPETSLHYQPELTLPDLLQRAGEFHPEHIIGYFDKNGTITKQKYSELLLTAGEIAGGLSALGLKKGDKIIIATQNNRETIEILWGCFLLGLIPTILQPPMTFAGYNPSVVKLVNVFEQLDKPYVFMSEGLTDTGDFPADKIKFLKDLDRTASFEKPELRPSDLAFIQFSSGSTGNPKGIMLSHSNLMINMDSIREGLNIQFYDHLGNWMPLFHDMGLIGYHLVPIYMCANQYQIETIDFITNPGLWLSLLSKQKITITGCPNFGLALVVRYLDRKKVVSSWDFSTMKAMLNGAEPISVQIMQDFVKHLESYNFHPDAMMPVYGMAEATLAISFSPLMKPSVITAFDAYQLDRERKAVPAQENDLSARVLSEVGVALNDIGIRIVDENGILLDEGNIGHIQIKGPSVTAGYYNNDEATDAAFDGEWLRTGDIGFFYRGRLYISGRHKDIIFKNGRNYFANDLEAIACIHEDISYGKVCFGGVTSRETGHDKVIAFVAGVSDSKAPAVFKEIRTLLRSNVGIGLDELVLIKSNEIPKTSSGKLQRYKLMQRYLQGEFSDRIVKE